MNTQLISQEDFTSVQEAQAGITKLFMKASKNNRFYRVMRNKKPLGVLIPDNLWFSLIEDLEAFSSLSYREEIKQSRKDPVQISSKEAKKKLGITAYCFGN